MQYNTNGYIYCAVTQSFEAVCELQYRKTCKMKKRAHRDANTARALTVVRFGHRPPARHKHTYTQTGPIAIHCAAN